MGNNPPVQIYVNKIKNRIVFKIKTGSNLELYKLSPETMALLGSTKKDVDDQKKDDQDKDGEDEPKLKSVEVILEDFNVVHKNYQQAFKVLFTFVPNKQFGQLMTIALYSLIMVNTTNTELFSIEVWFCYQNSKQLEIEDNVNMTLTIE